jgi:hypothetical protein
MKKGSSSQAAFLILAGLLTIVGGMIISPDGRLLSLAIAALLALIVLVFGCTRIKRIIALIVLVAVVLMMIPAWQQHSSFRDRYRDNTIQNPK